MFLSTQHWQFTGWDWAVLVGYLVLTTWVGHKMSGKQASIKDFFLGGRTLPWWAVSGSMIATEISALTFIGVPGIVFGLKGDWTYLQWGLGSMVARFAVAYWLIPLYYEKEIYSPYDFMGNRLGSKIKTLVTALFSMGSILGQSVRVLVTAIILREVTGMSVELCIVVIGVVAIFWTLMGGMQTVIWTDVMQFCLFIFGGMLAMFLLVKGLGWSEIVSLNQVVVDGAVIDKMRFLDLESPFDKPELRYTLWVGLLAMPFQNFTAFGVDQLNTQRMFCCGNVSDARKAMCWSSVSLLITLLMLAVGSGLFAWYQEFPPEAALAAKFADSPNNVFPAWIVREVPVGLSGLILAGAFAAAISSLDSILAALSQTSLSVIYGQERMEEEGQGERMVKISRIAVLIWGILLTLAALLLWLIYSQNEDSDLIGLAFGMVAYTYGPLLGVLLAALIPWRTSAAGLVVGTCCSVLLVAYFRPELISILEIIKMKDLADLIINSRPKLASEWFFPLNAGVTLACGLVGAGGLFRKA
ncbi:MAG: sodium:solute symporter family transporter [Luteolibacter sp.]